VDHSGMAGLGQCAGKSFASSSTTAIVLSFMRFSV
jgi:hypothetical protein